MSEAYKKEFTPSEDSSEQIFVNEKNTKKSPKEKSETTVKNEHEEGMDGNFEINEEEITEKLSSLGINFKYFKNKEGRIEYIFLNVQKVEGTNAFYLDTKDKKVIYFHFHFNGNNILHPKDKHIISAKELFEYINDNFEDVDEIVYGCCYPDKARKIIQKPIFIIGSGFSTEYRTIYNSRKNSITISPAS